ncbi:MAG: class IV adenylate cyclase [Gemmataceae bacterium]|nr:class IV adenylate cyclase [Gemmataceae bacterium]
MLEVEAKYRVPAGFALPPDLAATPAPAERHEDHYLAAPDRDLKATGEAFRLRRVNGRNFLTYKGPKHPGAVKTRTEIEVPIGAGAEDPADALRLLGCLGYRPVAVVRKTRRPFAVEVDGWPVTVCLDEVDGLGPFVEVEVLADEGRADEAQAVVRAVAADLGLTDLEPRSYLTLVLAEGPSRRPEGASGNSPG